jgi:hypothetical protein
VKETTAAIAAAGLVGAGLWWFLRNRAPAPAALPPPPLPKRTCAELSAVSMEAGLTCAGLEQAKKYLDPMWNAVKGLLGGAKPGLINGIHDAVRSTCEKSRPADLATRVYTNNGLNGPCLYASSDLNLWCAESRMFDAEAGGTYAERLKAGKTSLSYVGIGKTAAAGAVCVIYRSGCAPLPGYPAAWGKCRPGTMPLRGGAAGQPFAPGNHGGMTYFEAWAGAAPMAYLKPRGSGPIDKRTK